MPNALSVQLDSIARIFARDLVNAIREANRGVAVTDVQREPPKRGRGRPRKDGSDLAPGAANVTSRDARKIVEFVRKNPGCGGMDIRKALKLPVSPWLRAIQQCRDERLVRMEGRTKAARYWMP